MDKRDVLNAIADGVMDGAEDELFDAVKRRRTVVDLYRIGKFSVGDEVKFNSEASPKYLKGVKATITAVKTTTVKVKMPDRILGDVGGRFAGLEVNCPVSIIDPVEGDDA